MINSRRSPHLYDLMRSGSIIQYDKGTSITSTVDDARLMMVLEGHVRRYSIKNDGSIGTQIIYAGSDVFPLTKVYKMCFDMDLYKGRETYYYSALSRATIMAVSLDVLQDALETDPVLYRELFFEAGQHLRSCVHSIENISLGNAYRRVANELYYLSQQHGLQTGDTSEILLPATHQEIANLLGLTRSTVTLAMVRLREAGIITDDRIITIIDFQKLSNEAYGI